MEAFFSCSFISLICFYFFKNIDFHFCIFFIFSNCVAFVSQLFTIVLQKNSTFHFSCFFFFLLAFLFISFQFFSFFLLGLAKGASRSVATLDTNRSFRVCHVNLVTLKVAKTTNRPCRNLGRRKTACGIASLAPQQVRLLASCDEVQLAALQSAGSLQEARQWWTSISKFKVQGCNH